MNTHHLKGLIFSMLACAAYSTTAHADTVSADEAKQLAADFLGSSRQEIAASVETLELVYTKGSSTKPLYYVFNVNPGNGYIIMSADDCTAPVLAYSLESDYNPSAMPPAMQWLLRGYENEIKAAPSIQKPMTKESRRKLVRRKASAPSQRIYLPTPEWSQESPFNSKIPGNPLAGCVGTSMAMIMRYHNFPERGTGSYNNVSFDVAYDWANMRMDNYRSGYTQAEADAVGTLVYHAAASIGTQFGYSGSSAYEVKVPAALVSYFGYDPGVSYKKRSETRTQAEFDLIVENEIKAGRPVLYCGQDVTMGHAFVVDGYDPMSQMIHVNWGWGGHSGNTNGGWYASTALNPTVSQSHSFNNLTTIIYNIKPGSGNNAAWSQIHITADGQQVGMHSDLMGDLEPGKAFTVRVGNLKNVSFDNFSGKITVALFGADGSFKSVLSKIDGFSLGGMAIFSRAYADFRCELPEGINVDEGDMIRMATSTDGGASWLPVAGELLTTNELPAKGAVPDYFAIVNNTPAGATFTGDNRVIRGWNYVFKVVPDNPSRDLVTVKSNGYVLTPDANYNYAINNVLCDQQITVYVQNAADVVAKRSVWVGEPGTLESILSGADATTVKELTLFGTIDARDFAFMRSGMKLTRLDMSSVRIVANGANQANAIPREAFRGLWSLKEVILPNSVNRLNNGAFRSCGITRIVIPASVSTYEYNVFNGCSGLREVWVQNPTPVFVNWCVFYGCPKNRTVYCPNDASKAKYMADRWWHDPELDTDVVYESGSGMYPVATDCAFAVMEDDAVRYTSDTESGRYAAGTKVTFKAEYIPVDDNRMEVYANATLLTPDAEGNYTTTVNGNTIVHFDVVRPQEAREGSSAWVLTDDGGTVGLLTDAVNVIQGAPFTIRANSFQVKENAFWAAVLTTADGKIKEFISPIGNWSSGAGRGFKMNINCCVNDAAVREGNLIRLATSYNKKDWSLVGGSNAEVVTALPALNNQTPVYNFTVTEDIEKIANLSGVVSSAVRGRDLTFKITPKKAGDLIDMNVNGVSVAKGTGVVNYSFIAKEDLDFDIRVYTPAIIDEVVYDLTGGERLAYASSSDFRNNYKGTEFTNYYDFKNAREASVKPKVKVIGNIDRTDFLGFFQVLKVRQKIKVLDLSEANIVADRTSPSSYKANEFPANAFWPSSGMGTGYVALEEIQLPRGVVKIAASAFAQCDRMRELELPVNLQNFSEGGGLDYNCFSGCTALTTLYVPCKPDGSNRVHHFVQNQWLGDNTLGLTDPTKVTVVVNPEYLSVYKKASWDTYGYRNSWVKFGFNIVGEYPVYGINYETDKCFVTDRNLDLSKVASFLGDNVAKESLTVSGKLFVAAKSNVTTNRPAGVDAYGAASKVKIYDNGVLVPDDAVGADGSLSLTYFNPNRHPDKSGDHKIEVAYLFDLHFNCASAELSVVPEIRNNESDGDTATEFEVWNQSDASAPVLENVRENSTVRFRVDMGGLNSQDLTTVVRIGETVLTPDDSGCYNVEMSDKDALVNVYAVPRNGATLGPEDINVINAAEARDVTSIAFVGDIDAGSLKEVIDAFPVIENIDFSGLDVALPAEAMAGKETLTTVVLPQAADIEEGTFRNCVNLASVTVPECVNTIGSEAFSGCSSMERLSFTGIQGIGARAFDGCDNLTTIIFNAQRDNHPARLRRRAVGAVPSGYDSDAFSGLNPNCLVYLDEGQELPDGVKVNRVNVRTVDVDGNKSRVYEASENIVLDNAYPFEAVNTFNMADGSDISIVMDLKPTDGQTQWSSLVLPFAPTEVLDENGEEIALYSDIESASETGKNYYVVAELTGADGGDELTLASAVTPNKPYIAAMYTECAAVKARFVGSNATIEQTPDDIRMKGSEYDLVGTFTHRPASSTAVTYRLNDSGSAFVAENGEEAYAATVDANAAADGMSPFAVYMESAGDAGQFNIEVDLKGEASGISDVETEAGDVSLYRDGDNLVIQAASDCILEIFSVDGQCVKRVRLSAGSNNIGAIARGIYIINGEKLMI